MKKLLALAFLALVSPAEAADNFLISQPNGSNAIISATDIGSGILRPNVSCPTCSSSSGITIGTTTITGGTTTRILYDNAGVVGEYTLTGTGTVVVMQTSPTLITPVLGVAAATSVTLGSTSLTATKLTLAGGTLGDQAPGFVFTATQPAVPTGTQNGFTIDVTSAGSAAFVNRAFVVTYNAGYTGASTTAAIRGSNAAAGTASTLIPASGSDAALGNIGTNTFSSGTTTGLNMGGLFTGGLGNVNAGVVGLSQQVKNSATNIGGVFSAINTGTSPVMVGVFASLNQVTVPTVSAALIADNGAQAQPIALFRSANATVGSFNATGGVTATLTNSATTSAVCYTVATNGLLTYNSTVGTCTVSVLAAKDPIAPLTASEGYDLVMSMVPWRYDMKKDLPTYQPGEQIGFIADWVKDDRLVAHDPDGKVTGMRYEQYTAALTAAFQYMDQQVKAIKADNDNLRASRRARN